MAIAYPIYQQYRTSQHFYLLKAKEEKTLVVKVYNIVQNCLWKGVFSLDDLEIPKEQRTLSAKNARFFLEQLDQKKLIPAEYHPFSTKQPPLEECIEESRKVISQAKSKLGPLASDELFPTFDGFKRANKDLATKSLELAQEYMKERDYQEALKCYSNAFAYTQDWKDYVGLPLLFEKMGSREKAFVAYLYLAHYQLAGGELQESIKTLKQCTEINPQEISVQDLLVTLSIADDYQQILADPFQWKIYSSLSGFLKKHPQQRAHVLLMGACHAIEQEEYQVAEQFCQEAENCYDDSFLDQLIHLELLREQHQDSKIKEKLRILVEVYAKKELLPQKLKAYKMLARLDYDPQYYEQIITTYDQLNKPEKVLEWRMKWLTILVKEKDWEKAEQIAQKILSQASEKIPFYLHLETIYTSWNSHKLHDLWNQLGKAYKQNHQIEQAEATFRKAYERFHSFESTSCLAEALQDQNNTSNSVKTYYEALILALSDDHEEHIEQTLHRIEQIDPKFEHLDSAQKTNFFTQRRFFKLSQEMQALKKEVQTLKEKPISFDDQKEVVKPSLPFTFNFAPFSGFSFGTTSSASTRATPTPKPFSFALSSPAFPQLEPPLNIPNPFLNAPFSRSLHDLESKLLTATEIRSWGERVCKNRALEEQLFAFIESSKNNANKAVAAANAITILNAARVPLSGRNFQYIQIPGADLSYAIADGTDFSFANLSSVTFHQTFLRRAKFFSSVMSNVEFGQAPYFYHGGDGMKFSSDRKTVFVTHGDTCLVEWDFLSGKKIHEYEYPSSRIVAYFPDHRRVFIEPNDHSSVIVLDLSSGQEIHRLKGHKNSIEDFAISSDGSRALSSGYDEDVYLWDLSTGKELYKLKEEVCYAQGKAHGDRGHFVSFSYDDKTAFYQGYNSELHQYDLSSGQEKEKVSLNFRPQDIVCFSDNKTALSRCRSKGIIHWELFSGKTIRSFESSGNTLIFCFALSLDEKHLLSAEDNGMICLWDFSSGKVIRFFNEDRERVWGIAFSADGKTAFLNRGDGIIRPLNLTFNPTFNLISFSFTSPFIFTQLMIDFSKDGTVIHAKGFFDNKISLWDLSSETSIGSLNISSASCIAFAPDGKTMLLGENRTVRLWEIPSGKEIQEFLFEDNLTPLTFFPGIQFMAFSLDGKTIIAAGSYTVYLWDVASGKEILKIDLDHSSLITDAAFLSDGQVVLASKGEEISYSDPDSHEYRAAFIQLLDLRSGKKTHKIEVPQESVTSFAFSPEGKTIVSGHKGGTIRLWDVMTGKEILNFKGYKANTTFARFSPDGRTIFSGGIELDDANQPIFTLCEWDLTSQKIRTARGFTNKISKIMFAPDKKYIFVIEEGGAIKKWKLDNENNQPKFILLWCSQLPKLCCEDLDFTNAKELSSSNRTLLMQQGAKLPSGLQAIEMKQPRKMFSISLKPI